MMNENSVKVLEYVKKNEKNNLTAKMIADALGISDKTVNGIVTLAFQRKGLMERVPHEVTDGDKVTTVKYIVMTEAGRAFVPPVE